ncbi:hypothetical protein [Streptomyces smyrnaeus]|uniref:hypothetical protein n=1 Tax=Streptomyces smyrnaeus TaxID=1387713 RepID=UPI001FD84387|nr:hypothetical protein [Streptomyces smyrnaeus]
MSEFAQGPGHGHAPTPEQHLSAGGTERYDETAQHQQPHGRGEQAPAAEVGQAPPAPAEGAEGAGGDQEPAGQADEAGEAEEAEVDDGPRPLGVGVRPTGYGAVDAQLKRLEDADHLAVSGHPEVYEDVHRGLRESLAALDRPHTPRS